MQFRSLHLKKVIVKSEYTEKGNENDWGVKQPLYVKRLKRLLSLEKAEGIRTKFTKP